MNDATHAKSIEPADAEGESTILPFEKQSSDEGTAGEISSTGEGNVDSSSELSWAEGLAHEALESKCLTVG
ncbi:MAG: hypothetical protein AAGG44_10695, partial [Planctomycetota bacterium]